MSRSLVRFLFLGDPRTDRRIKNLISLFQDCNYEAELIFATPGERKIDDLAIGGATAKQLFLEHSHGVKMFLQYDLLLKDELRNAKRCDILFACELYSLNAAATAKKDGAVRKLFYDARELYTELPSVAKKFFKKWYWKRWERKGLKQTDLLIVTAPDDVDAIRHVHHFLPPDIVIRNLPKKEELKPNTYLRDLYSISLNKKIFVYIGGLQRDRGLERMIDMMKSLQGEAVFVLIGNGASKENLLKQCFELDLRSSVFFHPSVESEKVVEVLSSGDIGISLIEEHSKSYALALPSKIFEYMLAGLPVISSPLKQVKDLFDKTEGILFARPDNPDELMEICRLAMAMSSDIRLKTKIYVEAYNHYTFEMDGEALKNFITIHPASSVTNPIQ